MTSDTAVRRPIPRRSALVALAAVGVLALVGCGDDGDDAADDEGSGEAAVCEARAELDSSFASLGEIDIVNDGTDALSAAVDDIGDDVESLREAAGDEAGDEADAVGEAYDTLAAAVGDLGDGAIGDGAAAVGTALADFGTALGELAVALAQDCD